MPRWGGEQHRVKSGRGGSPYGAWFRSQPISSSRRSPPGGSGGGGRRRAMRATDLESRLACRAVHTQPGGPATGSDTRRSPDNPAGVDPGTEHTTTSKKTQSCSSWSAPRTPVSEGRARPAVVRGAGRDGVGPGASLLHVAQRRSQLSLTPMPKTMRKSNRPTSGDRMLPTLSSRRRPVDPALMVRTHPGRSATPPRQPTVCWTAHHDGDQRVAAMGEPSATRYQACGSVAA